MASGRARSALACLVAAALFGASTPLSKALLESVGPVTLAGLLYLGGAAGVLPWAFRGGSRELRADRRQRWLLAGAVLLGGGLGPVLMLLGLAAAPASSVSLWLNLETPATTLLAWALFREHLDARTWIAATLVLAGGIALAVGGFAGASAGLLVALACVCWGFDNNFTALVSAFTPAQTTAVKGLVAGTVNLLLGLGLEGGLPAGRSIALALAVGAVSYGASLVLYISGAQQLGASRSQLLFATSPFVGTALSWAFLGEHIHLVQVLAATLMAVALLVLLRARHAHVHGHERLAHTHDHRHDDGHHDHDHPGEPQSLRHTHPHVHEPATHSHPHAPDLHHRHRH
ncbi:MAG TPA: DMT family transporter [Thermoanaerobaculia bacterium]|nr:DMT family transporter [Thermoanaerobaculia bacterium]